MSESDASDTAETPAEGEGRTVLDKLMADLFSEEVRDRLKRLAHEHRPEEVAGD